MNKRLYVEVVDEVTVYKYKLRPDLEVGKEYDGIFFTKAMEKHKNEHLTKVMNTYEGNMELCGVQAKNGDFFIISDSMAVCAPHVREVVSYHLKSETFVQLKPNIRSIKTISRTYASEEMCQGAEEKRFYKIAYIERTLLDGEIPYYYYYIVPVEDEYGGCGYYVGLNQIIPYTKTAYKEELRKQKQLEKQKKIEKQNKLKQFPKDKRKQLINEMTQELANRDYGFTREAVEAIIDEWFAQKYDLINILSKHPKWNADKYMIQFDIDVERERNQKTIDQFLDWAMYECDDTEEHNYRDMRVILNSVRSMSNIITSRDESSYSRYMANAGIDAKYFPKTGQKTTRWINKIIKNLAPIVYEHEEFERKFAKFADALNPLMIKRHTCLSLHPLDYLLQSNGNSWRSCHYIGDDKDDAGCYCSGTISYMLDNVSMTFYTVSGDYNGDHIELEKKITRCMFAYNNGVLLQQRIYPQNSDGASETYTQYRNIVQEIIAYCIDQPNMWRVNHSACEYCEKGIGSTMYHDWLEQSSNLHSISINNNRDDFVTEEDRRKKMIIGAKPLSIYYPNRANCSNGSLN